jgi:hypothetical protein
MDIDQLKTKVILYNLLITITIILYSNQPIHHIEFVNLNNQSRNNNISMKISKSNTIKQECDPNLCKDIILYRSAYLLLPKKINKRELDTWQDKEPMKFEGEIQVKKRRKKRPKANALSRLNF